MIGFKFNGIHTSQFANLIVNTVNNPLLSEKTHTRIKVPGRAGELLFDGTHNNKILEFNCYLAGGSIESRRLLSREIAGWLNNTGTLFLDSEGDKSYAVVRAVSDISRVINTTHEEFSIIFETEPYQYGEDKRFEMFNSGSLTLYNAGTVSADTYITITGSGTITASLSGEKTQNFNLYNLKDTETVVLWSKPMVVLNPNTWENLTHLHEGAFFKVPPWTSTLLLEGNIWNARVQYYDTYL